MEAAFIRLPALKTILGLSRSSIYNQIALGLLPKPIPIADRAVGWLNFEIQEILDARIDGIPQISIKELVAGFHKKRPNRSTVVTPNKKSGVRSCQ